MKREKNLFVVDWNDISDERIAALLNSLPHEDSEWDFYNCRVEGHWTKNKAKRYASYMKATWHILINGRKYNNIIIWQQMIGFMLSILPRWNKKSMIINSMILYSPSRVRPGSIRMFLLRRGLLNCDALLYFSKDMACDTRTYFPEYASKIFSTYMPIISASAENGTVPFKHSEKNNPYQVFSGGLSDRDFDTVVDAFTGTDISVVIVCSETYIFKQPDLITSNITVKRGVSESEYHALLSSSFCVVVALEYENSSCGQLLFSFCMNNEIPIIASDCYGTRDYIANNENGILVPVKDKNAILTAYSKLVEDQEFKSGLLLKSKEVAAKMTFSGYLKCIDTIIHQKAHADDGLSGLTEP